MSIVLNGTTGITTPDLDSSDLTVTKAGTPIIADRTGSNGTILDLKKDGSAVGSIGSEGGDALYIQAGTTSGNGLLFTSNGTSIRPARNGATIHDTLDLGSDTRSFKDLYLSGGVYLGGTGAANYLQDYEEGTFTPSLGGNAQYNIQAGRYKKVGSIVLIYLEIRPNVLGTGSTIQISGLPFSATGNSGINPAYYDGAATAIFTLDGLVQGTAISLYGRTQASTAASQTPAFFQNNTRIYMTATYETTA